MTKNLQQACIPMDALINHNFLNAVINNFLLEDSLNALFGTLTIHVHENEEPYVNNFVILWPMEAAKFFYNLLT